MRNFLTAVLLTVLLAASLAGPSALGQTTDANLVGTVLDASGAGIPDATVEATNTATGVKYTTKTEASGEYRLNNLPVGAYDITTTGRGFATSTLKNVQLQLNKNTTANVTMQVGTVSSTVDVSEAATTIDT